MLITARLLRTCSAIAPLRKNTHTAFKGENPSKNTKPSTMVLGGASHASRALHALSLLPLPPHWLQVGSRKQALQQADHMPSTREQTLNHGVWQRKPHKQIALLALSLC
jgi:hypothetical protein